MGGGRPVDLSDNENTLLNHIREARENHETTAPRAERNRGRLQDSARHGRRPRSSRVLEPELAMVLGEDPPPALPAKGATRRTRSTARSPGESSRDYAGS